METNVFINVALDSAIKNYILLNGSKDSKFDTDFLVRVIRMLVFIYGEENILGLYEKKDEKSFTYLLSKYVSLDEVDKFYNDLNKYYKKTIKNKINNSKNKNSYFTFVQEDLINMVIAKYNYKAFSSEKLDEFRKLLYTINSGNKLVRKIVRYNTDDYNYIVNYFESKVNKITNKFELVLERSNVLSDDVYEEFGLTREKLNKLSIKELENINTQIFASFNLSPIDIDVNNKLLKKIKLFKKLKKTSMKKQYIFVIIILLIILFIFLIMNGSFRI